MFGRNDRSIRVPGSPGHFALNAGRSATYDGPSRTAARARDAAVRAMSAQSPV